MLMSVLVAFGVLVAISCVDGHFGFFAGGGGKGKGGSHGHVQGGKGGGGRGHIGGGSLGHGHGHGHGRGHGKGHGHGGSGGVGGKGEVAAKVEVEEECEGNGEGEGGSEGQGGGSSCGYGYKETSSGCVDINECEETRPCQQTCINEEGDYRCSCGVGYEVDEDDDTKCSKIEICKSTVDIILVLDSSGSMGTENNALQLAFASKFVSHFSVGNTNARFGAILFSDIVEKLFDLNKYSTNAQVEEALKRAPYQQGTTLTDAALDFVREDKMFSTAKGGRTQAADIVIVFTDGQSTYPKKTPLAAQNLKATKAKIIAVGIGKDVSEEELKVIASSDDAVFLAPTFGLLDYIEQTLSRRVCKEGA